MPIVVCLARQPYETSRCVCSLINQTLEPYVPFQLWTAADDDDDNVGQQQECAAEPAKNDDA